MKQVFQGDPLQLFQHLLDSPQLSEADLDELRKLINQKKKEMRDE